MWYQLQLHSIGVSVAQLNPSYHLWILWYDTDLTVQRATRVTVAPPSYLASRAWARTQRQLETEEVSFPEKAETHTHTWNLKINTHQCTNNNIKTQEMRQISTSWKKRSQKWRLNITWIHSWSTKECKWRKLYVNKIYFHIIHTKKGDPVSYKRCKLTKEAKYGERKKTREVMRREWTK